MVVTSERREIEGLSKLENLRSLGIETLCGHQEPAVIDTPLVRTHIYEINQ